MDKKKALQKTVGAIRAAVREETQSPVQYFAEYPKAMMTAKQIENHTATVNCGGEWVSPKASRMMAERVMADPGFQKYLTDFNALACIEAVGGSYPYSQIRITFREH